MAMVNKLLQFRLSKLTLLIIIRGSNIMILGSKKESNERINEALKI